MYKESNHIFIYIYNLISKLILYSMIMKIIVKFASEIFIKSRSVRIRFVQILIKNIKIILLRYNQLVTIVRYWDYIEIKSEDSSYLKISNILINIPGIHHFLLVQDSIVYSLEDIYHQIILRDYTKFVGKSFCIRVKRYGNHIYSSQEIERYLGNRLCRMICGTSVNLTKPDKTICLEIKNDRLFIVIQRYSGLGGLPIGTQKKSLSLISGGFDSSVASYMLIRRGSIVYYCFFNLSGNIIDTVEVYKVIYYLWNKFGSSHIVKVISINFLEVVKELLLKVKSSYIGIILKRMMIRAAIMIAKRYQIKLLVTGEVLGQVSSQTLDNLVLINNVKSVECLIFRPLIAYDKEQIISIARIIGTEVLSSKIPEYCGVISKKTVIKSDQKNLKIEENKCDFLLINKSVSHAYIIDVNHVSKFVENQCLCEIHTQTQLNSTDIILDIRTKNEQDINPFRPIVNVEIKKIPFYQLIDRFPKLDQSKVYLLYCQNGVMSKLQAVQLYQSGFRNVKIYKFLSGS